MGRVITKEEKKANRKKLYMFVLTILMLNYSWNFFQEIIIYENRLNMEKNRNIIAINKSNIIREKGFYKDEVYLASKELLNKNWNKYSIGGINFSGSGEKN